MKKVNGAVDVKMDAKNGNLTGETGATVNLGPIGGSSQQSSSIGTKGLNSAQSTSGHLGSYSESAYRTSHIGSNGVSSSEGSAVKIGGTTVFGHNQKASVDAHGYHAHNDATLFGKKVGFNVGVNFDKIGSDIAGGFHSVADVAGKAAGGITKAGGDVAHAAGKVLNKDTINAIGKGAQGAAHVVGKAFTKENLDTAIKGAKVVGDVAVGVISLIGKIK
jgi:hypothetical protein